jgi:hypothetical protein
MVLLVPLFGSFMLFTFPRVLLFGGLVQAGLLVGVFGCAVGFPMATDLSIGKDCQRG